MAATTMIWVSGLVQEFLQERQYRRALPLGDPGVRLRYVFASADRTSHWGLAPTSRFLQEVDGKTSLQWWRDDLFYSEERAQVL